MAHYFTGRIGDDGLRILLGLEMDGTAVALVEERRHPPLPPGY